jgi:hypothetical protein
MQQANPESTKTTVYGGESKSMLQAGTVSAGASYPYGQFDPKNKLHTEQKPILNKAISYVEQVKVFATDAGEPGTYNSFLDTLKDFNSGALDTMGVIGCVCQLFVGNTHLTEGFNAFCPPGYRIKRQADSDAIQFTTPMGTEYISLAVLDDKPVTRLSNKPGQGDVPGQSQGTPIPSFVPIDQLAPILDGSEKLGESDHEQHLSLVEGDNQSLPTLGHAITDSGYQSMTRPGSLETGEDDTDSNADSVRTDNRDSGLPENVKEQLSTYFAQEILDSIQLAKADVANAIDDICSSLPELLREFSTLVEIHARPGLEERACIFVRHQRNQIARNLRTILSSKPDSSDAPAARDRIDLLWGEHHVVDENPEDRVMADLAQEIKDPSESLLNLPEIPEARAYLIERSEYRWLLSRIQSMVKTMPTLSTDSEVRRDLIGVIGGGRTIKVELDWHFASFLEEQYERPEDVELQQVLCSSGLAENAYVAPSVEYADLLWPRLGKEVILCLSRGLRKVSVRMSSMLFEISRRSCS